MFKLFFLLFVLGCASAALVGQKFITVGNDYIQVVSDNGLRIDFVKNKYSNSYGNKDFDVSLTGGNYYKNFRVNNQLGGDVIYDLLVRYQGAVNDLTYQKLIYKLEQYVQQGDINPILLYVFQSLNEQNYIPFLNQYVQDEALYNLRYTGKYEPGYRYYGVGNRGYGLSGYRYGLEGQQYGPETQQYGLEEQKYGVEGSQYYQQYQPSFWNQILYKYRYPSQYYSRYQNQGLRGGLGSYQYYQPSFWNQISYQYRNPLQYYSRYQDQDLYGTGYYNGPVSSYYSGEYKQGYPWTLGSKLGYYNKGYGLYQQDQYINSPYKYGGVYNYQRTNQIEGQIEREIENQIDNQQGYYGSYLNKYNGLQGRYEF